MATHNQLGKDAEEMAAHYLTDKGFEILYRNWRHSHYEIDIIARKKELLHIVEVKCLKSSAFCYPEDAVTKRKFKFLLNAADEFLFLHPEFRFVQYDILSITIPKDKDPEYFLIEDVYL